MEKSVTIFCKNTQSYHTYPLGTSLIEIYNDLNINLKYRVVAARVNYKVEDLNFLVYKPKDIDFIDSSSSSGMRVYVRTLSMVLAKAVSELFPQAILLIEHPISKGYYCKLENLNQNITPELILQIKERVNLIISQGKRIYTEEKQTDEVKELFANQAFQKDKIALFETLGTPYCRFFRIDDFIDYYNGVLMPTTDYLRIFDLVPYFDGMLLRVPNRENPVELEEIVLQPKIFDIFKEYMGWNKIMNLNNVGEFYISCRNNESFNLLKVSEALHEKK
ncbi:MAG TPA: nucleoside kinase, partial [Paludibacter sp.]|nr:nucleoside kinase [Paludibacter sp.]